MNSYSQVTHYNFKNNKSFKNIATKVHERGWGKNEGEMT